MAALRILICLLAGVLGAGCATSPSPPSTGPATSGPVPTGARIARAALDAVGTPYRYGGDTTEGFDCSGLVRFAHAAAGIAVPRTTATQFQSSTEPARLAAGDIVFFRVGGKVSHSGIYLGGGRFVHAPSSGKQVSVARTDNPWFKRRYAGARRFR